MIEGFISYWVQSTILPKIVIRRIKGLCRSFLWAHNTRKKRSLVA